MKLFLFCPRIEAAVEFPARLAFIPLDSGETAEGVGLLGIEENEEVKVEEAEEEFDCWLVGIEGILSRLWEEEAEMTMILAVLTVAEAEDIAEAKEEEEDKEEEVEVVIELDVE